MVFSGHTLKSKSCRISAVIIFILIFFLVELVTGIITASITLQADAFHMLNDCFMHVIGLIAIRLERKGNCERNTFGNQRSGHVGCLISLTALITMCISLGMQSIQRLFEVEMIDEPFIVLVVALLGLIMNIVSFALLETGAGGGHSHAHRHEKTDNFLRHQKSKIIETGDFIEIENDMNNYNETAITTSNGSPNEVRNHVVISSLKLHVLTDMLGSIIVVLEALILIVLPDNNEEVYSNNNGGKQPSSDTQNFSSSLLQSSSLSNFKYLVDPVLSLLLVCFIIFRTLPLLRQTIFLLMQQVPSDIILKDFRKHIEEIEGVEEVHELHIWELTDGIFIGTVHVRSDGTDNVLHAVKMKFHEYNIHCTTIQVEDEKNRNTTYNSSDNCWIKCPNAVDGPSCQPNLCCPSQGKLPKMMNTLRNRFSVGSTGEAMVESIGITSCQTYRMYPNVATTIVDEEVIAANVADEI